MQRSDSSAFVYDASPSELPSEAVVSAVAAVSGRDPTAPDGLDPLATVVDPDALDALFRAVGADSPRTNGAVTFPYHDHTVTVHEVGRVTVAATGPSSDCAAD